MTDLLGVCERTVTAALRHGADAAEAYGVDGREVEVFLESNDVKMGKSQSHRGIGLRVLKDKGLGFASVNTLEGPRVEGALDRAVTLASRATPDPNQGLPDPRPLPRVEGLYDPEAEAFGTKEVLAQARSMLEAAREVDDRVVVDSGTFEAHVGQRALFSSRGVEAEERSSDFVYFMVAFAREGDQVGSFDYLFEGTHRVADVQAEAMAGRLAERVVGALGARPTETFRGTVLLNPYTVETLVAGPLTAAVNANNVQKGMSRLAGRLGKAVATDLLTVRDDGTVPGGLGSSSFDREGVPHAPLTLLAEGRLESYLYNDYTARKEGRETTGHATGDQRNVPSIGPTNFLMEPGTQSREELIGEIERGLLVTRFSGWPQSVSGDFSGAVKGGFLIEKGEVVRPVKETLIAGNVFELLENLSGASREVEEVFNARLPYLRFEDVSVTSG